MAGLPANGNPASFATGGAEANGGVANIRDALQLIYSPQSSNQARQDAQAFLEDVKAAGQAPSIGFELASDASNPPVIRHYGLSLLEDAIKHKWAGYTEEQAGYLRGWVLQLAESASKDDPLFLRNKVALLWVEIAKRCWAAEWMDMDELLMQLWRVPGPTVHKELVLYILETLADEVFGGDDAVVALREGVLSKACVDIFTPAAVLDEAFPNRQVGPVVRSGDEGWLRRVTQLLNDCLDGHVHSDNRTRNCAMRALAVMPALMPWAIPKAIVASGCVPVMCKGLATPNVAVQKVRRPPPHGPRCRPARLTATGLAGGAACALLENPHRRRGVRRALRADVRWRNRESLQPPIRVVYRGGRCHRRRQVPLCQEVFRGEPLAALGCSLSSLPAFPPSSIASLSFSLVRLSSPTLPC